MLRAASGRRCRTLAPIVPPYDRLPQLQWRYTPSQLGMGLDASVELDTTRFHVTAA
jgi:LPS-assembly protein